MGPKKVLIADDEIHIRQVIAMKLKNNGFEVLMAQNGCEGFEKAVELKPDIIISDYQMPGMNGIEMIKELRKHPDTADIPVLMLTARGFDIEADMLGELKITDCLSKPFSPKEVLERVKQAVENNAASLS